MKRIALSTLTVLTLAAAAAAEPVTFYTDPATGQVFTQPAEGRVEMGDFISAKEVYLENQAQDSAIAEKASKDKSVDVFAKTSKLEFSGTHYLGYTYTDKKAGNGNPSEQTGQFEMRRNYVQVKAFLFDDPASYARVTLDAHNEDGYNNVHVKYAYLYLNDILPFTGVEFGIAHRPWLDYEEHQSWWYRSVDKTFVESKQSADLTNSADYGVNFKTKTDHFTSELGIFNGEGYHGTEGGTGQSLEWRLTAAILGEGTVKRKQTETTYWDASFYGQYNMKNNANDKETYAFYGLHSVFNTPSFLLAGHYIVAENDNKIAASLSNRVHHNGRGFSFNGEFRFGENKAYRIFARYDNWTAEDTLSIAEGGIEDSTSEHYLYGVAWQQNKNVTWILNGKTYLADNNTNYKGAAVQDFNSAMLTADVHW